MLFFIADASWVRYALSFRPALPYLGAVKNADQVSVELCYSNFLTPPYAAMANLIGHVIFLQLLNLCGEHR